MNSARRSFYRSFILRTELNNTIMIAPEKDPFLSDPRRESSGLSLRRLEFCKPKNPAMFGYIGHVQVIRISALIESLHGIEFLGLIGPGVE